MARKTTAKIVETETGLDIVPTISTVTRTDEEVAALAETPTKGAVLAASTVPADVISPRTARVASFAELRDLIDAAIAEAANPSANHDVTLQRARALVSSVIEGR